MTVQSLSVKNATELQCTYTYNYYTIIKLYTGTAKNYNKLFQWYIYDDVLGLHLYVELYLNPSFFAKSSASLGPRLCVCVCVCVCMCVRADYVDLRSINIFDWSNLLPFNLMEDWSEDTPSFSQLITKYSVRGT